MKIKAFHKITYGLYLIASEHNDKKAGYIANTAFQVTSQPEQLAISCHKDNFSTQIILDSGAFSVSVLKKEVNMKIIGDFGFMSSTDINKFAGINFIKGSSGAPIVLDSCVAWFDCKVVKTVDLGTHYLIIGEVLDSDEISDEEPLTYQYYREKYKMYSPKNSPTYIEKSALDAEIPSVSEEKKEEEPDHEHEYVFDGQCWVCVICGFTYNPAEGDPSMGIAPGTPFEELPEDYKCPICNASKEYFKKE
jgi:flavin reductase (DIM6/NTAB) family NADH-FMN oxidoreductase RutF/rubredoxin